MVDNKSLVVGTKYILTDYKTKYQINSSNSSINKKYPIIGNASSIFTIWWGWFNDSC
jgi:hypothetical protein